MQLRPRQDPLGLDKPRALLKNVGPLFNKKPRAGVLRQ
jgi:hypothetical protein